MHYYKFNIADWQSSTRHLTPEEEGVYFRLINYYYDTEKPIPLETQSVIRRLMLGSHSDKVASILSEFFVKTDRGYEKEKCNELIKDYKKTANKNKKNGALGGRPKKNAASKETQSVTSGMPAKTQNEPKNNPNQEPLTTNQEPRTSVKRFTPPTVKEVSEYCQQRKNFVDPQRFVDYYESNGWVRGKTKIKDWKACVRTWEGNSNTVQHNHAENKPRPDLMEAMRNQ